MSIRVEHLTDTQKQQIAAEVKMRTCVTLNIYCPPGDIENGTIIGTATYCQEEGETMTQFAARVKQEHKELSQTLCP